MLPDVPPKWSKDPEKGGPGLSCYIPLSLGRVTEEHKVKHRNRNKTATDDRARSTHGAPFFLRLFHR